MRATILKTTIIASAAIGLTACTSPATPESPAAGRPSTTASTPTAEAGSGCDEVGAVLEEVRTPLAEALESASEAGTTDPVDSEIAPLVDRLGSVAEDVDDPELKAATGALTETVDAMRIAMNDITVARLSAQSAEAIVAAEIAGAQDPAVIESANAVIQSANAALQDAADRVGALGGDFTNGVTALEGLCD